MNAQLKYILQGTNMHHKNDMSGNSKISLPWYYGIHFNIQNLVKVNVLLLNYTASANQI